MFSVAFPQSKQNLNRRELGTTLQCSPIILWLSFGHFTWHEREQLDTMSYSTLVKNASRSTQPLHPKLLQGGLYVDSRNGRWLWLVTCKINPFTSTLTSSCCIRVDWVHVLDKLMNPSTWRQAFTSPLPRVWISRQQLGPTRSGLCAAHVRMLSRIRTSYSFHPLYPECPVYPPWVRRNGTAA